MAVEGDEATSQDSLIEFSPNSAGAALFARQTKRRKPYDIAELHSLNYHFARVEGMTLSQSAGGKFRSALAWLNERKALLSATVFVAFCNFYYLDIRYFSARHPEICPVPSGSKQLWSRFNNSADAVAILRAFLFFLLVMAIFALYWGADGTLHGGGLFFPNCTNG